MKRMMNKRIYSTVLCLLFLSGCSSNEPEKEKSYDTLAEAEAAITFETRKIDELMTQIQYLQSDKEKKTLVCEVIPKQYDKVVALMDANTHLMTASDLAIEADFRRLLAQEKAKFLNHKICA
jgi:outer membrane murein-binding lipoprotein Lpp